LNYRYLRPQGTPPTTPWSKEWFHYGYNDRLVKLQTQATLEPSSPTCMVAPPISLSRATKTEWQYSYSPSGEREIKRLVRSPKTDSTCGSVYPWTYYLLGTNDEQQVVYHGRQISRADCDPAGIGRRVFFYPVEYRSYGVDGVNIVWERNDNGTMVARFVGTDLQGSERYAVGKNAYQKVRDYLPFGVDVAVANDQRRGYLGKESDYETAPRYGVVHAGLYHERLMDMSARKYSKTQGAFTSVDALWGLSIATSPYIYSHHDPINFADPSGYGEITSGGSTGSGASGNSGSRVPKWARNFIMIDGYSDDESRAMKAETQLHRDVKKALWADQPQYAAKSKSGRSVPQAIPAHAPQYFAPEAVPTPSPLGEAYDWLTDVSHTNDVIGLMAAANIHVMAKDAGVWVAASGKAYKMKFYGNQHFTAAAVLEQKAASFAKAKLFGRIGYGSLATSYLITGYSIATEGYKPHHGADLAVTTTLAIISVFFPGVGFALSAAYLLTDIILVATTKKSITEHIFDNK